MNVTEYIEQHHMISPGDRVIAAVSGGADSVDLLFLLRDLAERLAFELQAVHVEHGIRGEESYKDMRFTEALCERLSIPLRVYHVDAPAYAAAHGTGLEEAARILRYEALEDAALLLQTAAPGQVKIALAHHLQDQAETVLFRLARGSGRRGLGGMQPVRPGGRGYDYIRPLLQTSRTEIEEDLRVRGESFCVDSTNADGAYARNRIRASVLPELAQVNTRASEHIARAAEEIAEAEDYISKAATGELRRISRDKTNGIFISIPELCALHPALQKELLRQALIQIAGSEKDLTAGHIGQILDLAGSISGKKITLPYGVRVTREFDDLVISKEQIGGQDESSCKGKACDLPDSATGAESEGSILISAEQLETLKKSGQTLIFKLSGSETLSIRIRGSEESREEERENSREGRKEDGDFGEIIWRASITPALGKNGLFVRKRLPGDFFYLKDGHRKKLKPYLIEKKIPVSERGKLWLLATPESEVLWLFGSRFSKKFCKYGPEEYQIDLEYCKRV